MGDRILFDYKDKDGHKLHGILAIPDDYKPGQTLPMLVNFYEKISQGSYRYHQPRYGTGAAVRRLREQRLFRDAPGHVLPHGPHTLDMLNSVEAAAKKVIEMGYADPKHVGLQGHSYSGQAAVISRTRRCSRHSSRRGHRSEADFNQLWKVGGDEPALLRHLWAGAFRHDSVHQPDLYIDQSACST